MMTFQLPPLGQLPHFDKQEYWDLIQDLGQEVTYLSVQLRDRDEQLSQALAQIASLQSELSRPEKTSENASLAPSQDHTRPVAPIVKKKQRLYERQGHQRVLPEAEVVWDCESQACEQCGADLAEAPLRLVGCQRVIDIPPIQAQVIELRRYERSCSCGHCQQDAYPKGYEEAHQHFGPRIHALISYFNGTHHVAHERLQNMMQAVFGVEISAGAIVNSLQRTRRYLHPLIETFLERIRQSRVVGSDETGLKLAGKRGWLWVVQTPELSYFAAVDSRAGQVLEDILIDASGIEVWCSDLYSAQLTVNTKRYAICNAHQLRDLQYAIDAGDTVFAPAMQQLLRHGLQLTKRRSQLDVDNYQQQVQQLKQTANWLNQLDVPHPDVLRLQKRFRKHFDAMWLFLEREDVPFDNNASERALRPATTHRKVIGCFRTDQGADAYVIYRSLEDTARKQHIPIFDALHQVLGHSLHIS
ncbi:MAG: IS66 family transposase [Phototrophicaceae bacterium]